MLVFDPNLRINANEALHHAYFNEYRSQYLFSGLNLFSMNHGQDSLGARNMLLPSEEPITPISFDHQTQHSSLENASYGTGFRPSTSSGLMSSSSEDQLGSALVSPANPSAMPFPLRSCITDTIPGSDHWPTEFPKMVKSIP